MTVRRSMTPLAVSALLLLPLTGCGADEPAGDDVVEQTPAEQTEPTAPDPDVDQPVDAGMATPPVGGQDGTGQDGTGQDGTGAGEVIELVETSYDISLADGTGTGEPVTVSIPSPGTYTFEVTNESDEVHALAIAGHGVEAVTDSIEGGESTTLEVELTEAGEYDVWCPVGNHRELGMDGSVVVQGG